MEDRQPDRIWTSRKFVSAWILTVILVPMRCFDFLDNSAFATTFSLLWSTYFASNVGSKWVSKKKES